MKKRHLAEPQPYDPQDCSQNPYASQMKRQRRAEAQQPRKSARRPPSILKKVVTMPFKALFFRRGAEVHDSAGLDEAVAYYVSSSLQAENRFWAGFQGQAQQLWG